jgi:Bacterial regulatory proteins, tetR family
MSLNYAPDLRGLLWRISDGDPQRSSLVRETGYEGLTLDAVAARAHMSKATLVAHALKRIGHPIAQTANTGSLRGDFAAIMRASTTAAPARTPG